MAKTKTPFFGLGAHGSVGRSITAQKLPAATMLRSKPLPAYRRTLPQQYQRWLYQDYAYLWRDQSEATRRAYAADGVRSHLTGFQYWMKRKLSTLEDILAIYHLDETSGALFHDLSPYGNDAVIIGASPATGRIAGAYYFDGINDVAQAPTMPHLEQDTPYTIELYGDILATGTPLSKQGLSAPPSTGWFSRFYASSNLFRFYFFQADGALKAATATGSGGFSNHAAGVYNGSNQIIAYCEGNPSIPTAVVGYAPNTIRPLTIGRYAHTTSQWIKGTLDHIFIWSIALPENLIKIHALRRYP